MKKNVDIEAISPGRHRIYSPFGGSTVLTARGLLELVALVEENRTTLEEEAKDEVTQELPRENREGASNGIIQ